MPRASLKIRVRAHSDALHRVLCVCHRRTLEIAALNYTGETIELAVAGAERHLDRIDRWLSALPDVLGVQLDPPDPSYRHSAAARGAVPPAPLTRMSSGVFLSQRNDASRPPGPIA